jgi:hypothetical protein
LAALEDPVLVGWDTGPERAILGISIGRAMAVMGDFARARQCFEESHALFKGLDLRWGMALGLVSWGNVSAILGDHRDAQARLEQGLALSTPGRVGCRAPGKRPGSQSGGKCFRMAVQLASLGTVEDSMTRLFVNSVATGN